MPETDKIRPVLNEMGQNYSQTRRVDLELELLQILPIYCQSDIPENKGKGGNWSKAKDNTGTLRRTRGI